MQTLNKIPAVEDGEMTSGKKPETGLPFAFPTWTNPGCRSNHASCRYKVAFT